MLKFFRKVAKHVYKVRAKETLSNNPRLKQLLNVELYYMFWALHGHYQVLALHKSSEKIMCTTKNNFMYTLNLNFNRGTPFF